MPIYIAEIKDACGGTTTTTTTTTTTGCYQDEITPQEGKFCKDINDLDYRNICDGSKDDCVLKGKEKCSKDPNCYGIMYNDHSWTAHFKGVMTCTSMALVEKPGKDWSVFLQCSKYKFFENISEVPAFSYVQYDISISNSNCTSLPKSQLFWALLE